MIEAGCAVEEFQKQAGFLLAQAEGLHGSLRQAWLMPTEVFFEHLQNMLQGRKTSSTVAILSFFTSFLYPIGSMSHSLNTLPSAACRCFHIPVWTKESFITRHPQEASSELGSSFRGIMTILGVPKDLLAKASCCVSPAETEKQTS